MVSGCERCEPALSRLTVNMVCCSEIEDNTYEDALSSHHVSHHFRHVTEKLPRCILIVWDALQRFRKGYTVKYTQDNKSDANRHYGPRRLKNHIAGDSVRDIISRVVEEFRRAPGREWIRRLCVYCYVRRRAHISARRAGGKTFEEIADTGIEKSLEMIRQEFRLTGIEILPATSKVCIWTRDLRGLCFA